MKLILASNGNFLTDRNYSMIGMPFEAMRIGYVVTASRGKNAQECRQGEGMRKLGIHFETYDIQGKTLDELEHFFADKNIIYVEGGDTFYLLNAANNSKFKTLLEGFFERGGIYVGTSAGAYIMGPSTETSLWKNADKNWHGLTDLAGLGFVPFMIFAHYKPDMEEQIRQKKNASAYPVKILKDDQAIIVEGNMYTFAGSGEEVAL